MAREFRRRLINRFSREAIESPFQQRRVHVTVKGGADGEADARRPSGRSGRRMTLRLYNTLSRQVEPFEPLQPGRVSLYTCGPTVYNYAHIGNFRTFLFEDLLRRWLEASGYDVFHVMNLTDVDDKTINGAAAAGKPLRRVRRSTYIDAFSRGPATTSASARRTVYPRATDYIPPMIALVEGLLEQGHRIQGRGRLGLFLHRPVSGLRPAVAARHARAQGRRQRAGQQRRVRQGGCARLRPLEGGRAGGREGRRGLGRALRAGPARVAPRVLGHGARAARRAVGHRRARHPRRRRGPDLPPSRGRDRAELRVHREGSFARYWLHGEFLNIEGTKMSKRFGNITTPRDLREDGVAAGAIRLLMFQTHYRKKLDLTDEALAAAQEGSRRLGEFQNRLAGKPGRSDSPRFDGGRGAAGPGVRRR